MNLPLPKTTQGVYRLSVSTFYFLQGLVFASWACRIPDIKNALGLNDADAVPVGQMSAMALSGYLVGRCGSREDTDSGFHLLSRRACVSGHGVLLLGTGGGAVFLRGGR